MITWCHHVHWPRHVRIQEWIDQVYSVHRYFRPGDQPNAVQSHSLYVVVVVHFSAHISKWELVCKFGVIFHIFIISCLCSRFHVRNQWFFYSVITFSYIKCFVHSYTVDVVFTLSYCMQTSITFGEFTPIRINYLPRLDDNETLVWYVAIQTLIARFMWPTWGPSGPHVGPKNFAIWGACHW